MTSSNKHHVWQINLCKSLCYNKSIVQVFTASYHVQCQLSVVPKLPNSNFHIGRIARCIDRSDSLRRNPSGKSFNGEQPRSHRKNGSQPTNQRPTTQHDTKTTSNSAGIYLPNNCGNPVKQSIRWTAKEIMLYLYCCDHTLAVPFFGGERPLQEPRLAKAVSSNF